ncbi:MAG: T9SS type A sorting domain-containing protein, partial [Chitinophagaceae bacterium]
NDNATPLYIAIGADNKLSSTGAFDGSAQPFIFNPGITRFEVPFSGTTLKWELKTYNSSQKTATSSSASSTSSRCASGKLDITSLPPADELEGEEWTAFPNPAIRTISILTGDDFPEDFIIYNLAGKQFRAPLIESGNGRVVIDISKLARGMYYVRFNKGGRPVKFIRQ